VPSFRRDGDEIAQTLQSTSPPRQHPFAHFPPSTENGNETTDRSQSQFAYAGDYTDFLN